MNVKKLIIILGILTALFCLPVTTQNNQITVIQEISIENERMIPHEPPKISADQNKDHIDDVFDKILSNYSTQGYFPQVYTPSLQATYYALYILKSIGKLGDINQNEVVDYIMSHYDNLNHNFMDEYAYRYLDMDYDNIGYYYPYSSVLQVNCYAILSLELLNSLHLINIQDSVDYIMSCINPFTGGFIGQPYSSDLAYYFKMTTLVNTYFAVTTIDKIIGWGSYPSDRLTTTSFIDDRQEAHMENYSKKYVYGGFYNDNNTSINTLKPNDNNIVASYYGIKSLKILDTMSAINESAFEDYLIRLYDSGVDSFNIQYYFNHDIMATGLGLELTDIVNCPGIDKNAVVTFLLNNRNEYGTWNYSRQYLNYELIDTFRVIQALNEMGEISQLTQNDKNEIASMISIYQQYNNGYSLLSNNYISMATLYSIVNAFSLYDRTWDLDVQKIYDIIDESYYYHSSTGTYSLSALPQIDKSYTFLHSYPIEYSCYIGHDYVDRVTRLFHQRSIFMGLSSLEKILKLDDFDNMHDLADLADDIIATQFLGSGYSNYGGFLPSGGVLNMNNDDKNRNVYMEYTYYAIRSLEILADYLGLGPITNLGFDENALATYITKYIGGSGTTTYFTPKNSNKTENILQNTYYMIYTLKAINQYTQDNQKIQNYVEQNLNYSNIKSVYFSWKISEILNLSIDFDMEATQSLVNQIYSDESKEFYLTTNRKIMDQEVFSWICEMAKNDKVRLNPVNPSSVNLGDYINITTYLSNIILEDFGDYSTVKYESNQIGIETLVEQADSSFQKDVSIPVSPTNYPIVTGDIVVYEGAQPKAIEPIAFSTNYNLSINPTITKTPVRLDITINISLESAIGLHPLFTGQAYLTVYKDNKFVENVYFSKVDEIDYSVFSISYNIDKSKDHDFYLYLLDGYDTTPRQILEIDVEESSSSSEDEDNPEQNDELPITAIPLLVSFIGIPTGVIIVSSKYKNKLRNK